MNTRVDNSKIARPQTLSSSAGAVSLRRNCACGQHTIGGAECEGCKKEQTAFKKYTHVRTDAPTVPLRDSAPHLSGLQSQMNDVSHTRLSSWIPASGREIGDVPIHFPSRAADDRGVRALATDGNVHLGTAARRLPQAEIGGILAHEAVHVAQQMHGKEVTRVPDVEIEAHHMSGDVLTVQNLRPRFRATPGTKLADTPYDKMIVERAKKRLALLQTFVNDWTDRQTRQLHTSTERDPRLGKRAKMDEALPEPKGMRTKIEEEHLAKLNRLPLEIDVSENQVLFRVKFHVRFEDPKMSFRFGELKTQMIEGIKIVWNQKLSGASLGGRKFAIEPQFTLVASTAQRNQNFWLITVRSADDAPVNYPGCKLDQPPPGDPTSVTDPTCDGGVMSIPPLHIGRPGVLGHELLHLFGLVDRYILLVQRKPGKKATSQTIPARETGGRPDPLGGEDGTILSEDLSFLFDKLGVYTMEENRGLATLHQLEKEGMNITGVLGEIHRQEEIIRLGHDPRSLLPIRKNFKDKMLRDVERL